MDTLIFPLDKLPSDKMTLKEADYFVSSKQVYCSLIFVLEFLICDYAWILMNLLFKN